MAANTHQWHHPILLWVVKSEFYELQNPVNFIAVSEQQVGIFQSSVACVLEKVEDYATT